MSDNPFSDLPPPQAISALWAIRAMLVFPDKHMADDCLASLECSILGATAVTISPSSEMMNRLLILQKFMGASAPIVPKTIEANIEALAQVIHLDDFECRVLELAVMLLQDEWLFFFCSRLPVTRRWKATYIIAAMLDIGFAEASKALAATSGLHLACLLQPHDADEQNIAHILDLASENAYALTQKEFNPFDLLQGTVEPAMAPKLHTLDFSHIRSTLDILKGYTGSITLSARRGANILMYGPSGSGKTELAKSLIKTASLRLLEVPLVSHRLEVLDPCNRLKAYLRAQACLKPSQHVLLFDHFEGVFHSGLNHDKGSLQSGVDLAWLYRIMEYNPVPTLWLTTSLDGVPSAFLSRMDAICEIPPPSATWHKSMLNRLRRSRQINLNPSLMTDMTGLTPGVMDKSIQTAALFMDDAAEASANRVLKSLVANFQKATEQAARSRNDRNDASWILKFLVDALQSANDSHNKQVDKSNE